MSPTPEFLKAYGHLVWLIAHRPDSMEEQKAALRDALAALKESEYTLLLAELNVAVAEAAGRPTPPSELPWLSELATRLAGHTVRLILFGRETTAAELLGLARAIASQPSVADPGPAFDAKVALLALSSVQVVIGRENFVRAPTPALARRPFVSRTPSLEVPRLADVGPRDPSPLRLPTPMPQALRATPSVATVAIAEAVTTPEGHETRPLHDEGRKNWSGVVPRELEPLLVRLAGTLSAEEAPTVVDQAASTAEARADEGIWIEVVALISELHERYERERNADVRRVFLIGFRRLAKVGIMRGIATLLPRRPELRETITSILSRAGEAGSDALVELLVTTQSTPDRRAYRAALTQCRSAVPALMHLLGDPRWYAVRNAAEMLGEMSVTDADGRLSEVAQHADPRVRRAAAAALGRLATPRALQALLQMLADEAPQVRSQAVQALIAIRSSRAVPSLISMLEREEDPDVQGSLLAALGSMPTAEGVSRLIKAAQPGSLLHRKPLTFRLHAVSALAEAGTDAARAALRALLKDREREVRQRAEQVLGEGL